MNPFDNQFIIRIITHYTMWFELFSHVVAVVFDFIILIFIYLFCRRKFSVRQYIPGEMDMLMKPPVVSQNIAPPMCM